MRWLATLPVAGLAFLAVVGLACSEQSRVPIDAAIDMAVDMAPGACAQCTANQLCVAKYDGVCGSRGVTCVARTVDCPNNACSTACEAAYCGAPLQCQNRAPCGGEPPGAFTCYGP